MKCDDSKQQTKIVVCKLPADDFLQKVTLVVEDFRDHAGRVNTQFYMRHYHCILCLVFVMRSP